MDDLPFSVPINVRKLSKKGEHIKFEADESQRALIAQRYDLISIEVFTAEAQVVPWRKGGVRLIGDVAARFTQPCAVSAEPLAQSLDESIEALFVPEGSKLSRPKTDDAGEIIIDVDGDDPPETFNGDTLDLASVWLEFFALGIDPFGRLDDAELPESVVMSDDEEADEKRKESPFAALAALKKD